LKFSIKFESLFESVIFLGDSNVIFQPGALGSSTGSEVALSLSGKIQTGLPPSMSYFI